MSKLNDVLSSDVQADALQIFVTSWNMGNAQHQGFETVFKEKDALNKFDIFVLGLQESTYSTELDSISHLKSQLEDLFKNYYIVKHCYRAQLQLYVFAKTSLKPRISNVEESIENTGFLGVFPNKGGLLVAFHVDGTKFAFVSCHLAAHEGIKYCEARNASIIEILGGVRAGDRRYDITEQFHHVFWMGDMNYRLTYEKDKVPKSTRKNTREVVQQVVSTDDVDEIDVQMMEEESDDESESDDEGVPLAEGEEKSDSRPRSPSRETSKMSDKRLSVSASETEKAEKKRKNKKYRAKTMQMICDGQFEELMKLDELNREIASGRVLNGFTALQPSFYPTFKRTRNLAINPRTKLVRRHTSHMSSSGESVVSEFYNAKRMPSFCDRVLFKSLPTFAKNLRALFFESCENALSSDHKPVRAGFSVSLTKGAGSIRLNQNVLTSEQMDHVGFSLTRSPSRSVGSRHSSGAFSTSPADNIDMCVLVVRISDLKGRKLEDMDLEMFGGKSDPYLIVTTDPPCLQLTRNHHQNRTNPHKFYFTANSDGIKSSTVMHNCDPDWRDTLTFYIGSTDFAGLAQNASFVFAVWDYDKYNADDLIGCFTVPFRDILLSHARGEKAHVFDCECYSNSEIMGKVSGKISIDHDVHELHNHFQEEAVQEKLITLSRAAELVNRDPSLVMQQGAACCSIN